MIKRKMKTFIELYQHLQKITNIRKWLSKSWTGKDKQESLLRLFAGLDLIPKLRGFKVCKGNFNKGTIKEIESKRDIFFENNKSRNLKDKGDKSDLTLINNDTIIAFTSKNNKKQKGVGKYDINDLLYIMREKYPKMKQVIGICTRYKEE